jgi:hypothetical protein
MQLIPHRRWLLKLSLNRDFLAERHRLSLVPDFGRIRARYARDGSFLAAFSGISAISSRTPPLFASSGRSSIVG